MNWAFKHIKRQQAIVDDWNRKYPVGQPVIRYRLIKPLREACSPTKTRSIAWLMGGHSAMVMVEGIAGGVAVESLKPICKWAGPIHEPED